MAAGGNAVDAAIAAAAAIAVVYPHMNGVGGDNFWLIYDAGRGRLRALNGAGRSAAAATLERYRGHPFIPTRGGEAALTVPGAVSGWWLAHEYSRDVMGSPVAWRTLLADAVTHARDGFPASACQRRMTTGAAAALFEAGAPDSVRRTLWPLFHPERLGDGRFTQTALAATLTAVMDDGAEAFYHGPLARRIADGAAAAGSPLTAGDLASHRADWVEPLRVPYRDGEAASFPPPTQGFAALAILGLLEGFEVAGLDTADLVHLTVEATKLAFQDRDRWLTDPTVADVPVARLLDAARLAERRRLMSRRTALPSEGPPGDGDTIAIVTADGAGNAVSLIQSLYHEFGAGVVAGDTGVLLQNRGAFFSLDPAHPNHLAPRKRTATTLIPSMYLAGGRPRFVYGTMGGEGQPQTQAALVTRMVDLGLGPQAAVEAPRWLFGRTWGEPSRSLRLESRFDAQVAASLRTRGHDVQMLDAWSDLVGHAQAIAVDPDGLRAGSDPRADGAALGG
ncbi:MAG TPA: gamma-glutamyltransferase family protein [Candidatus Limnocylindria bacterium]|nr:gamma-glutamyltransferase family protein [Candidatus Limnocylindria bacterium]